MRIGWLVMIVMTATWITARTATAQVCDPLAQTGCSAGQKCTWLSNAAGCTTDGTIATGGACVGSGGSDDCVAGNVCIYGVCEAICSLSPDSCGADTKCSSYAGLFTGTTPALGACDFLCDPVTQQRGLDCADACGSPDPSAPTRGCFVANDAPGACTGVPATVRENPLDYKQGSQAYGPNSTSAYVNGCAPGFAPLLRAANDVNAPVICIAFCEPGPTSVEDPSNANGLVGSYHGCSDRCAPGPVYECRYLWFLENDPPTHPDGVGFCMDPDAYLADLDGDPATPDEPWPRCADMTAAEGVAWGCAPYPGSTPKLDACPDGPSDELCPGEIGPDAGPGSSPDAELPGPDGGEPAVDADDGGCCRASQDGGEASALLVLGLALVSRARRRR